MTNPDATAPPVQANEAPPPPAAAAAGSGFGVSPIVRRWRREDLIRKGSVVLRGLALFFSLLSFIVVVSNRHGGWRDFDKYQEFRYLMAIALISTLYNAIQAFRHLQLLSTGKEVVQLQQRTSAWIDFSGDQIVAYLLISAASAAVPMTNRMRDNVDNNFTDSIAASISMAFFAFFSLSLSALFSGFKLSTTSSI